MKRAYIVIPFLLVAGLSFASVFDLWTESFTATTESAVITSSGAVLNEICVSSSTQPGGILKVWNGGTLNAAGGVVVSTLSVIDTSRQQSGCYLYNTYASSGIVYNNGGVSPPATVQILWSKFSR